MSGDRGFLYKIRRWGQVKAYQLTSPEFMSRLYFRVLLGYKLNLKDPKTFNEKTQWLKLYEWPKNPVAIQCGDKYTVRKYIEGHGCGQYLVDLIGVWERVEDIEWDKLPEQFAMKCTHGCGYNIICDSKKELDIAGCEKKLRKWMKEDFGKFNAEPHYSKMKPRIICEKYLGGDIVDYKFYVFNGKVQFMYIAQGFGKGINERITFFDADGRVAPFQRTDYAIHRQARLPEGFAQMKRESENWQRVFLLSGLTGLRQRAGCILVR